MFESAEVGHKVDKASFDAQVPGLREALLEAQFLLREKPEFAVVVLISGVDGAGKGETANLFNEWMDPRHIETVAFGAPTDEERERPFMWRFWRALPPKGKIGIMFGSWYTDPIVNRVNRSTTNAELDKNIADIVEFEKMLTAEKVVLVKLWFHLSKEAQEKRLKALEADPKTRWRVTKDDWEHFKIYDRFRKYSAHTLTATDTGNAPWTIIEGNCPRYRSLYACNTLLERIRQQFARLEHAQATPPAPAAAPRTALDNRTIISNLDLSQKLSKKDYEAQLEKYQGKLALLTRDPRSLKKSVIVVFEGVDAAGKGGAIRRVTGALDARHYSIVPIAAPSDEERAQPYLWRFWRHIPRLGRVTIFDRSWYGRVLVERVEGFATQAAWQRAYTEINHFEAELIKQGAVVVKFWLQISQDEQLRRFEERKETGFKAYKITDEDWRNRDKWPQYEVAVNDMIEHTSTEIAPWTLIGANDKYHARIKILKTLCEAIESALDK
ncbi:polyphosphate:AMP phosphotransferase [Massilia sp. TS11]|uniref:polyphosphate:AMP phosphotransferase n=1 Tax=Massilia sp. TS11 TaxID=2908003 RepID=UPI001EDB29F4|nr:polyphosphate:AMP phosphotransferase [Massilia sp. TS11]MCG2586314.1 polyphosphate:AMP phosphotransferase [Massilia sp. TS11]